ncbi:MAG: DUF4442 domain-containing protein [Acidobacteria bacterium]|nr:MAG: DUF4442 domain-containing protein [Acidobacteriota bacterium]MCE7959383.1 DUF4442 domain-containing protein [Acidobacteria bacterium ACB2]
MATPKQRFLMRLVNLYPPYVGAGVSVRRREGDDHTIRVTMPLRFYNRNLFGTQFGGSLYSMCDPWFVFLLVRHLGPEYVVWDRSAAIEFVRPGRGRVSATFHVPPGTVEAVRQEVEREGKAEPVLRTEVLGEAGEVVARVEKRLWVRRQGPDAGRPEASAGPRARR